eukprot:TRINITY_DN1838_c0_g2_i1.p1 TRINITY_DN1838_c0_g2~~TRINITY_DN1838_c0_g2_i1.p1  ORF type:complete len:183 (-),score=15.73 TRINITY_DN1838_c0_g2_i1:4-552(-)
MCIRDRWYQRRVHGDYENQGNLQPKQQHQQSQLTANLRLNFIRKVFIILSCQLGLTVLITIWGMYDIAFKKFMVQHPGVFFLALALSVIVFYALACYTSVARTVPWNYVLLIVFTVCESYIVAHICAATKPDLVVMAAVMTLGICLSLLVYALTTKTDFTTMGGALFVVCCGLALILSLIHI